jgi:ubiquinone biosynthesis protein COQ9
VIKIEEAALRAEDAPDWADAAEARLVAEARRLSNGRAFDQAFFATVAEAAGLSEPEALLLAPNGPGDLAALLFARHDADALAALKGRDPAQMKVRERIFMAVTARVEAAAQDADLVRQTSLFLARPRQIRLGLELGWRSADLLWRWAGDRAADENHYSKRVILSGLLLAVLQARLSQGAPAAERRLQAGIDAVMRFETIKAKLPNPDAALLGLAARLGALRFRKGATVSPSGFGADD